MIHQFVAPAHIYGYLALEVFGTTKLLATDKLKQGKSPTIEYSKKAISILCQTSSWNGTCKAMLQIQQNLF